MENAQLFEKQNKMLEEQKLMLDSFIETLASSIDARDKITSGHSTRVKMYSTLIAQEFGITAMISVPAVFEVIYSGDAKYLNSSSSACEKISE